MRGSQPGPGSTAVISPGSGGRWGLMMIKETSPQFAFSETHSPRLLPASFSPFIGCCPAAVDQTCAPVTKGAAWYHHRKQSSINCQSSTAKEFLSLSPTWRIIPLID